MKGSCSSASCCASGLAIHSNLAVAWKGTEVLRLSRRNSSVKRDDSRGYILARTVARNDYGHGDTSSEFNAISQFKAMEGIS
jgi:hypothetical protein